MRAYSLDEHCDVLTAEHHARAATNTFDGIDSSLVPAQNPLAPLAD